MNFSIDDFQAITHDFRLNISSTVSLVTARAPAGIRHPPIFVLSRLRQRNFPETTITARNGDV